MRYITVRQLKANDTAFFIQLIQLFGIVFEMKQLLIPSDTYLQKLLKNKDFHVFVAIDSMGKVVGGLTGYTLHQYYSINPLAYIFDLAVKKELQFMGIGKMLVEEFKGFCRNTGFDEIFVQADKVEKDVVRFYRSTKPSDEEQVVHFYYKFGKE